MAIRMKKEYSDDKIKAILSAATNDSAVIDRKMEEAYAMIRQKAKAENPMIQKKKRKGFRKLMYSLTSAAALLVCIFAVGISNPVWAANLPIIGGIFEKIQEIWRYGEVPEEEIISLSTEKGETEEIIEEEVYPYQMTANGITIKLTEYYATSQAVFLGMRIESEEAFPGFHEPKENDLLVQLFAVADVSYEEGNLSAGDGYLEGVQVDEYTYEGVLRMDFRNKEVPENFEMDFILSNGYLYFANADKTGLRNETFKVEGVIENIPIALSENAGKVIEINEVNELGIGLQSIKISPVELIIYPINENNLEELLTFEVALDAEGRKLEWGYNDGIGFKTVHAIEGRDISTITVYSCEWDTYMSIKGLALEEDPTLFQDALEENALYKKVIDTGIE